MNRARAVVPQNGPFQYRRGPESASKDLLFQAGQLAEASLVVHADRTQLGSDNTSAIEAAFGERLTPA